MYGSGSVEALFSPEWTKKYCNENTNNVKCSLPVIVAESLIDIVVIIGKALQQLQPGTAPCISAFFTISGSKRYAPRRGRPRPVRPCQGLRGWLTSVTWLYAARCLDFLLQIAFWNFSVWYFRRHGVWNRGRISFSNPHYHYQKNCSWFKEKKLSQSCRPSKKLTVIIHNTRRRNTRRLLRGFALLEMTYRPTALARSGRISRGIPHRAVFSFTITRYLVRMKRK